MKRVFMTVVIAGLSVAAIAGIITDSATVGSSTVAGIQSQANTADTRISTLQNDAGRIENNIVANSFRISINGSLAAYDLDDGWTDQFEDQTGVDTGAGSNYTYDATDDYYSYAIQTIGSVDPDNGAIFFQLEETSGTDVSDDYGETAATSQNDTSTMTVSGKHGNALDFNGSTDWVTVNSVGGVAPHIWANTWDTDDFSISAWLAADSYTIAANGEYPIGFSNPDAGGWAPRLFGFYITTSGTLIFGVQDDNQDICNFAWNCSGVSGGTWLHCVGTWDASDNIAALYVNGELKGKGTNAACATFTAMGADDSFMLGNEEISTDRFDYYQYNGKLDSVMVFTNRLLSASDVLGLYNAGSGVTNFSTIGDNQAVKYDMEDTSGTAVTDSAGSNNGTSQNDVSGMATAGKLSNGFDFNGSSDYILNTSVMNEDWGNSHDTESFSMCVWAAADDWTPAAAMNIAGAEDSDSKPLWMFGRLITTGTIRATVRDDGNQQAEPGVASLGWTDGTWHHIAMVWNVSEKAVYNYLDGVLHAAATNGSISTINEYASADIMPVGCRGITSTTAGDYWNGKLDQFILYTNKALNAAEIMQLYNAGSGSGTQGGVSGGSMVLQSTNTISASVAPTNARVLVAHEDVTGTATFGTDVKAYVSSDAGSTWDEMVFGSTIGELTSGVDLYAGTNIITGGGADMLWKIETTDNTKAGRVHAVGTLWKE